MEKVHILEVVSFNDETVVILERTTVNGTTTTFMTELDELGTWIVNGLTVTYEETEQVKEALRYMKCQYVTIETDADGSNEHDVYLHKAIVSDGTIKMDVTGQFLKSYKRVSSAVKFAESFNCKVIVS